MTEYTEHFITTINVDKFHYLSPSNEEIVFNDIAHPLSMMCRFGGHCLDHYSVAEHCVRVAQILAYAGRDTEIQLLGLFHDAEEAYLPDIPSPEKHDLPGIREFYLPIRTAIYRKFGVINSIRNGALVKEVDNRLCFMEAKAFGLWRPSWAYQGAPLDYVGEGELCWSNHEAEKKYYEEYERITNVRIR